MKFGQVNGPGKIDFTIPPDHPDPQLAIEFRHTDWYNDAAVSSKLYDLLETHGVTNVLVSLSSLGSPALSQTGLTLAFRAGSGCRVPEMGVKDESRAQ